MDFIISISRYILPFIAIFILIKCVLTLLLGQVKDKTYGYIVDMQSGKKYELNMWETAIGKSQSCDIVLPYTNISRFQVVICRRNDNWYIYDVMPKNPTKVNGETLVKKIEIEDKDTIKFNTHKFTFRVVADPVQRVGKKKTSKKKQNPQQQSQANQQASQSNNEYTQEELNLGKDFDNNTDESQLFSQNQFVTQNKNTEQFKSPQDFLSSGSTDFYNEINPPKINFDSNKQNKTQSQVFPNEFAQEGPKTPALINKKTGEIFMLCENEISVGSYRKCDIAINDNSVSPTHCLIVLYEDGWVIENLSNNLTMLNSSVVNQPQLLFEGDIIKLGAAELHYTYKYSIFN